MSAEGRLVLNSLGYAGFPSPAGFCNKRFSKTLIRVPRQKLYAHSRTLNRFEIL